MNNKKILIIAFAVITALLIVFAVSRKNNSNKDNTAILNKESIISDNSETVLHGDMKEIQTDVNGLTINTDIAGESDKSDSKNSHDNSNDKSSAELNNNGLNEMDDIFTDEAIENITTKKNDSQKTTDKNGETNVSGDGWSDFY